MQCFDNIAYLALGTLKQQEAYKLLKKHQLLVKLDTFDPVLAGTIPINVNIPGSDLDIICCFNDKIYFEREVRKAFSTFKDFKLADAIVNQQQSIVANFIIDGWPVEIFGQYLPTRQQNAYVHMVAEYLLLERYGETLRTQVISLKKRGYKTEPAFAKALGLKGNPYITLLNPNLTRPLKNH